MRPDRAAGFTLIEMVVLIAILSVVLGFGVMGTSGFVRSSRLAGSVNTLIADLRYARTLATTQRTSVQVLFAADGYQVLRVSPAGTLLSRPCPQGVTCSATDTATFFPWGLATPVTITLANADGSKDLSLAANGNVTRD